MTLKEFYEWAKKEGMDNAIVDISFKDDCGYPCYNLEGKTLEDVDQYHGFTIRI